MKITRETQKAIDAKYNKAVEYYLANRRTTNLTRVADQFNVDRGALEHYVIRARMTW